MNISTIHWGAPHNIWYFGLCIIIVTLLYVRYTKQNRAYQLLATHHNFLRNTSRIKQWLRILLTSVGFLFLCIALLRPQWNKTEETIMQEGRDVYIALDISRSMLATDCTPNRLVFAKEKIKQLVKNLSCERIGLILFSGSAFVQCPLTSDYAAFYLYLDAVDVELISSGTTALDQAIKQALTSFSSLQDRKSKLLVLYTDGEDFSHNLTTIQQEATDAGLSIFTIGIGTPEGAPIPLFDHQGNMIGHQKDAKGRVVISHLNEDTLQSLSSNAGGNYIRATHNNNDIKSLVNTLSSFEKEKIEERTLSSYEDQYHYFVLISFICFALEWLL